MVCKNNQHLLKKISSRISPPGYQIVALLGRFSKKNEDRNEDMSVEEKVHIRLHYCIFTLNYLPIIITLSERGANRRDKHWRNHYTNVSTHLSKI